MTENGKHRCLQRREYSAPRKRGKRNREPRRSTLLDLVQQLLRESDSERYVIEKATRLINGGRVLLIGSFRGARIDHRS
jgi:hypothetical protein